MGNGKNLGTRRELQPLVTHARGRTRADVTRVLFVRDPRGRPGAAQRPGVDRHRAGESDSSLSSPYVSRRQYYDVDRELLRSSVAALPDPLASDPRHRSV